MSVSRTARRTSLPALAAVALAAALLAIAPGGAIIPVRFTVTMLGQPGTPMLTLVDEEELARRKNRRAPLAN